MSSNTTYFGRHSQEMNRVSLVKSKTTLNHDKCQLADAHSMSKICKDYVEPTNHGCTDRTYLLYHKDRAHLKNEATDCPIYDKCESKMCSICQCSLEKEVKCFTCKCEIRQSDHCDLTKNYLCTCSYFNLLNRSSITRDYSDYSLGLSVSKSTDIQWKSYTWRGIFIIIIAMLCTNICNADPSKCAVGIRTPGWTWPHGDIVLEHGHSLKILCILNKTYIDHEYPGKNSSDLVFFRNMKEMEPEYITIINETTISMYVQRPSPAEDMYYCKLRLSNDNNQHLAVCLNKVVIGFKPVEPENFTCISHNWENMICSWDPVKNYVTTRFTLLFKLPGRAGGRKLFPCPKQNKPNKPNTCLWDASTNPIYRQPYEYYLFILNIENMLGNFNVSYKFHHFAHVIPAKPANLSVVNKTEESAMLHWSVPFPMQNFPPGLHHRITYQNQWENEEDWKVINIINDIHASKRFYNLTGLNYSNTGYDIRVYMKSALSVGEDKWSEFSGITFRTPAKLPALPPRTDIGSFEIAENTLYRDIYLYWQTIPSHLENGKNFRYQIDSVEENGQKVELLPNETTKTYAKYKGINLYRTYRFELVSMNLVGMSKRRSQIIVPSKYETPPEPIAFTKIAFDGGLYELSWKPPITNTEITNYTIFWCNNERDRPYQCTGYLDWVHVSNNTTVYNMTVPNAKLVYQFAISVNTEKGSSGMVWSSCTVIHNKVVGKMKSVWINHIDSDFIDAGWKMDCSDRIGIIEKYTIYYCPIVSPFNINCKGPKLNKTIKADPQTIRGSVNGLKPYTTYMIAVSVTTKNGESLHSDPLYNTTLEAAPSTPPKDVTIVNVTNTTMFITWKPPDAMNGVLRYYEVYYNGHVQKVEEADHIELKELLAYKNYSVNVVACTVACSIKSPTIYKVTEIGVPGKIFIPNVRFMNSSQVMIKWSKPQNSAGHLDYYEISSSDGEIQNSTRTEAQLPIPNCKTVGKEKLYQFRVRAVNIAPSNTYLKGPWSDPGEGNCYSDGPSFKVWVVIWMIGITSAVAFIFGIVYTTKIMWRKCKAMQDVEVQLPPGLTPNMKLLQKGGEQHIRQSSADSSGCSSGQESVTSSLTSNSRVSSDSGTEIDPIPVTPNKLLETLPVWEGSSSLRQRNISVTRPALVTETAHWDSYVKVAKSGEPIIGDTSSLARSTPNLTDSTGYTTSQHTWSSTGYISMPSSEELSSNPSLVPKEPFNASCYITNQGASKPMISESEENAEMIETTSNKPENKTINLYTALAYLEQIEKDKKVADSFRDLDNMEFTERNKLTSETIAPLSISDKTSKPYVQTGIIDMLKQPLNISNMDPKRSTISTSFATTSLTDSCNKPFVSSFVNPTTLTQTLIDSSSKPYVAVASVSEIIKKSNAAINSLNSSKKSCTPCTTTDSMDGSKPYVLATSVLQILQRQKEKTETPKSEIHENKNDDSLASFPIYWRSSENLKPSKGSDTDKMILEINKASGYVTIAENPKLDQQIVPSTTSSSYIQHDRFNKPLPQNTVGQSSDEQYCKVTVVPSTMQ